jgi:hypothetical protein
MNSFTRQLLENRQTRDIASLESLYDLRDKVEANPRRSYEFDSGDGRIVSRFWSLEQVDAMIYAREASIEHTNRRLCRTNLKVVRLVR